MLVNRLKTNTFFVNVPLKLLSPEAFLVPNALNIVWRPGSAGPAGGAYSAPPDLLGEFEGLLLRGGVKMREKLGDRRDEKWRNEWEKGGICVIVLRGMDDPDCRR